MKTINTLISLLTIGLQIIVTSAFSQQMQVPDYEQRLSYTEFETDYYIIDKMDLDNISLEDKVKLKELKSEREYEKYLNKDEEFTTVIKHIATENIYEEWMEEPEVILIDKDGVSLFSFDGKRINRIEHAPEFLELAKNTGTNLLPNFNFPRDEDLRMMGDVGMQIEELEDNFIKITFKSKQIIYNEELLYIEKNDLNENGDVMHSMKTEYMQMPSGEFVFSRIRESTIEDFDNNIKAEHVFLRLFSNYLYEDSRWEDAIPVREVAELTLTTNVGQTTAILNYEPFSESKISTITIFSTSGRVVKAYQAENSGRNEIDINGLAPGVYIFRVESSGRSIGEKFIKL